MMNPSQKEQTVTSNMAQKKRCEEKKEKEVCPICADNYTPVLRRKIVCKYCSKDACTKCIEQYLLGRIEDAHCIHCRVNYNDSVLKEICTKTYLQQTYFRHRQEILINRERASLPALQTIAKNERVNREFTNRIRQAREEMNAIRHEKARHILHVNRLASAIRIKKQQDESCEKEQEEYDRVIEVDHRFRGRIREKKAEINQLLTEQWRSQHADKPKEEEDAERKKFIRRCMKAGCQGFLSTAWKCGICEHYSCSKCFTVKGPEHDSPHTCLKEDLETAELIRSDSKPCPKCGEFINKSSGCDQMYCITCHTPWSWTTGKIVTSGVIHNPHYYEWLRRNGGELPRNPADIPCGGYPAGWELRNINQNTTRRHNRYFYEFHRICMELQEVSERNYRSHIDQQQMNETHVRFLLGDFSEKEWGKRLAMSEKRRKRDSEIQEVFAAFRMVAVELINRIQHYRDDKVDAFSILPINKANEYLEKWNMEVQALIAMVNDGLKKISQSHYCQVPVIEIIDVENPNRYINYRIGQFKWKTETRRKTKEVEEKKDDSDQEDSDQEDVEEENLEDEDLEEDEEEEEDEEDEDQEDLEESKEEEKEPTQLDRLTKEERDILIAIERSLLGE